MLTEPMAVTLKVTEALHEMGVPYLLGGSLASSIHGTARTTIDADLVADLRSEHIGPLVRALGADFYADAESIRDAIRNRRSFNVVHLKTMFKVDVFISKQRPFDRSQFQRRVKVVVATHPERAAYVATPEDTILAKLEWYKAGQQASDRQWRDAIGVVQAQGSRLDTAYLRHWADVLGLSDLLERAMAYVKP